MKRLKYACWSGNFMLSNENVNKGTRDGERESVNYGEL